MGDENDRLVLKGTTNAVIEHVVAYVAVYGAQRIVQQVNISINDNFSEKDEHIIKIDS